MVAYKKYRVPEAAFHKETNNNKNKLYLGKEFIPSRMSMSVTETSMWSCRICLQCPKVLIQVRTTTATSTAIALPLVSKSTDDMLAVSD